jgi:hypothetical protein
VGPTTCLDGVPHVPFQEYLPSIEFTSQVPNFVARRGAKTGKSAVSAVLRHKWRLWMLKFVISVSVVGRLLEAYRHK